MRASTDLKNSNEFYWSARMCAPFLRGVRSGNLRADDIRPYIFCRGRCLHRPKKTGGLMLSCVPNL